MPVSATRKMGTKQAWKRVWYWLPFWRWKSLFIDLSVETAAYNTHCALFFLLRLVPRANKWWHMHRVGIKVKLYFLNQFSSRQKLEIVSLITVDFSVENDWHHESFRDTSSGGYDSRVVRWETCQNVNQVLKSTFLLLKSRLTLHSNFFPNYKPFLYYSE